MKKVVHGLEAFRRDEAGFAFILTLILLPFMILALITLIDIQRASVYKADLQMVADALAKAGAVELDGDVDAVGRANSRMAQVVNKITVTGPVIGTSEVSYRLGTLPQDQLKAVFLDAVPAAGQSLDDAWLAAHGTTDHALAHYVYIRAALPAFSSITGAVLGGVLPFSTVASTSVAKYVEQRSRTSGPCDLGLYADSGTITGGNNAEFQGAMTIYGGAGISLGKPVVAPSSVMIVAPDKSLVTNLSGGTFTALPNMGCMPYGVDLAKSLINTLSATNRSLLPDWTADYNTSALGGTTYSTLAGGTLYTTNLALTFSSGGSSDSIVLMSAAGSGATVTFARGYQLSDAVINTSGDIIVGDEVVFENVTLIAGGSIIFGNMVDMGDPTNCNERDYGVELFAGVDITIINTYKLCGVLAAAVRNLEIKDTSNAGDADIKNVHLEAGQNLIFKNNLEYNGVSIVYGDDDPFDSDYSDDEGITNVTPLASLLDY